MDLDYISILMVLITVVIGRMMHKMGSVKLIKLLIKLILIYFYIKISIGIETWNDGSCYQGEYIRGKKHGYGVYKWTDGSKYQGEWEDNCLNGYVN